MSAYVLGMNNASNLISYKSPMGGLVSITVSQAIESWKKDNDRRVSGLAISERSFTALDNALKAEGVDPLTHKVEVVAAEAPSARRFPKSYTAQIEEAGDINNLLSNNGNSACAE